MPKKLKEEIFEFIDGRRNTSIVEITNRFGEGNVWGELAPNITFLFGMSQEVGDAVMDLMDDEMIFVSPCHIIVYAVDGAFPRSPVVKKIPADGYKKRHWQPVVFNSVRNAPDPSTIRNGVGYDGGI